MKFSRRYSLVLGLAAALAQGCGGDSTGTPGGGNNNGGSGSGGSGNTALSSCNPTNCMNDAQYNIYSQAACDTAEAGKCGAAFKAKNACSIKNDKCNPNGGQDHSAVKAACAAEFDAWEKCNATQI